MKIIFLTFILTSSFALSSLLRIHDVKQSIKSDTSKFITAFIPDEKFSISVELVPLRNSTMQENSDELPFINYETEDALDIWEDPTVSTYALYSHIKEVKINIEFSENIEINNIDKFKNTLLKSINLIPGRDKVFFETYNGSLIKRKFSISDYKEYFIIASILFATLFIGSLFHSLSNRLFFKKKIENLAANKSQDLAQSSDSSKPLRLPLGVEGVKQSQTQLSTSGLSLEDPKRVHDMVKGRVSKLSQLENFPTLNDIILLEELLTKDTKSFSYLIFEFSSEIQKDLYQIGKNDKWFEGFCEFGLPTKEVVFTLDKMIRHHTQQNDEKTLSRLLIYMWRLGSKLPSFISELDKNFGIFLLKKFPKNISIPIARKCYPGAWGDLFSKSNTEKSTILKNIKSKDIIDLEKRCLELKPLLKLEALTNFKGQVDLLNYLDKTEPQEEKEIYQVLNHSDSLKLIRAPFYKFFELDTDKQESIFRSFSLKEWALASFNISRDNMTIIKGLLSEKESYLFSLYLSELDVEAFPENDQVMVRRKIAHITNETLNIKELSAKEERAEETINQKRAGLAKHTDSGSEGTQQNNEAA